MISMKKKIVLELLCIGLQYAAGLNAGLRQYQKMFFLSEDKI